VLQAAVDSLEGLDGLLRHDVHRFHSVLVVDDDLGAFEVIHLLSQFVYVVCYLGYVFQAFSLFLRRLAGHMLRFVIGKGVGDLHFVQGLLYRH